MAWTGWLVTAHRVKCNRSSSRCSGTYVMWHWSIKNRLSASTARPCARDRLVGGWATDRSFTDAIPNQSAQISMQSQWQCLETDPGVRQGHSHQFNSSKTDQNRKAIFACLPCTQRGKMILTVQRNWLEEKIERFPSSRRSFTQHILVKWEMPSVGYKSRFTQRKANHFGLEGVG